MLKIAHVLSIIHEKKNVIANYFTCKLILCCNQQWDRTEIRNARNILSLSLNLSSKMILFF